MKTLKIDRKHVQADPGKKFSLIGPDGLPWFGDCLAVDHGPKHYYAVTGRVTSGPAEWVGLTVVVFGPFYGETLQVMPEALYQKSRGRDLSQVSSNVVPLETVKAAGA